MRMHMSGAGFMRNEREKERGGRRRKGGRERDREGERLIEERRGERGGWGAEEKRLLHQWP